MNFWTENIISLLQGSGKKLSKFMPLSKIKTCFYTESELKFGKMEFILNIIVRISSWKIKQKSNKC